MSNCFYSAETTALLIVDPYNDMMSEGGKLYEATRGVAEDVGLYANLRRLIPAVRAAEILIVVVPHRRWRPDDAQGWRFMSPTQARANDAQLFADATWGGGFHAEFGPKPGDVVVQEHWGHDGFSGGDLDLQLRCRGLDKIVLIGMGANTSVEGTARRGSELGYHVTLVRDATAAFGHDDMRAAHDINGPHYANSILTTRELLAQLSL
jgi:nicotinamidase-related amidase